MRKPLSLFALLAFSVADGSHAWDNFETHPTLSQASYRRLLLDPRFEKYLRENLGQPEGTVQQLGLYRGFDGATDGYLEGLRFQRSLNALELDRFPFASADSNVAIVLNDDPDDPMRYPIEHLIRAGTFAEDVPNPRARHHFLDPEKLHEPPSGNRGLDNEGVVPVLDIALAEFLTSARGGNLLRAIGGLLLAPLEAIPGVELDVGNFHGTGRSALDRALNRSLAAGVTAPSEETPENFFALPDAERYLFRAQTAPTRVEREHFLALHFLAFGHALHLLQDMGVPAHVRNDFVVDHLIGGGASLERAAGENASFAQELESAPLITSRPRAFLHSFAPADGEPAPDLSRYAVAQSPLDASGFDVADFWGELPAADRPAGHVRGLAELANGSFFSRNTVSNDSVGLIALGYPAPNVPTGCGGDPDADPVWGVRLPRRAIDGSMVGGNRGRFLSSPLVPHLARCRFLGDALAAEGAGPFLGYTVGDSSVNRDYLELLMPKVVEYSLELMRLYFEPRIDVVPLGENRFELINRSRLRLQAEAEEVRAYFDDVEDSRSSVQICSGPLDLGPGEKITCDLDDVTLSGAPAPRSRGDFTVVIRGQLGERGTPVANADAWETADFVTLTRRVLGWRIAYQEQHGDGTLTDAGRVNDVAVIGFDLASALATPEPMPFAIEENLSAGLRLALAPQLRDLVDFYAPSAEPGGTRIAYSSDVRLEGGQIPALSPSADDSGASIPSELRVLDLLAPSLSEEALPAGLFPSCSFECPPTWDQEPGSDVLVYSADLVANSPGAPPDEVVLSPVGGVPSRRPWDGSRRLQVTSAFGDTLVGTVSPDGAAGDPDPIFLANAAANPVVSTHRFILRAPLQVVACAPESESDPCFPIHPDQMSHGADPRFSSDGTTIVMTVYDDPELVGGENVRHHGNLYLADLGTGAVTLLHDAGGQALYPAFSPDGEWIAFQRKDDGQLYVIPATGGTATRVSIEPAARLELSWLPTLVLPE